MTNGAGVPQWRKSRAVWWAYTAFGVIGLTVAAMGALAICAAEFAWQGFWRGAGQPFATVIAGMAALAAGGLAFYNGERQRVTEAEQREIESQQWREEQRRETAKDLRTRFIAAAAQLADDKASIRRSAVYVIAGLADDWYALGNHVEHQVCIDVLTGYLITPNPTYTPTATHDTSAVIGGQRYLVQPTPPSAGEDVTKALAPQQIQAIPGADNDFASTEKLSLAVTQTSVERVSRTLVTST